MRARNQRGEFPPIEVAKRLCEKLLTHASPLGLYAEELDPHTGHHLGNCFEPPGRAR